MHAIAVGPPHPLAAQPLPAARILFPAPLPPHHPRDDILAWAARRSGARCIAALNASLKTTQLETCVAWNTATAMNRMTTMAPTREGHPQQGTRALVAEAVSPANLCRMCPTWQPWL